MGLEILVITFTLEAAIAMIGLVYILREFELNRRAVEAGNGSPTHAAAVEGAWMLLGLVGGFVITNGILLLVGVGSLVGARAAGWLLVLLPVIQLAVCVVVLRSLRKQAQLAGRR